MNNFFNKLDTIIKYVSAFSLAIMVLMIFINTVLRYFVHSSIVSTEEVCRFLIVLATFFAIITVWHEKSHIALTTITDRLKGKSLIVFRFITNFLTIGAFISMAIGCYEYIGLNSYYAQITGVSYAFMILPVMISGIMCLLITISDMSKIGADLRGADK